MTIQKNFLTGLLGATMMCAIATESNALTGRSKFKAAGDTVVAANKFSEVTPNKTAAADFLNTQDDLNSKEILNMSLSDADQTPAPVAPDNSVHASPLPTAHTADHSLEVAKLKKQLKAADEELAPLMADLDAAEGTVKKLTTELTQLKLDLDKITTLLSDKTNEHQNIEKEKALAEQAKGLAEDALAQLRIQHQNDIDTLHKDYAAKIFAIESETPEQKAEKLAKIQQEQDRLEALKREHARKELEQKISDASTVLENEYEELPANTKKLKEKKGGKQAFVKAGLIEAGLIEAGLVAADVADAATTVAAEPTAETKLD